ncbi:flagellar basal body rod C-terminal domain-containing protein [Buchnera aphidicola (Chaitoregma tattakana)]|uniref:flagellar basal body rod C-terminal domain-containing protein n=1 Tax=Buchnera aphidicola TaxID=9 RepID=UPI0031B82D8C
MQSKINSCINFANQILDNQSIINNNLSNTSTVGFKSKFSYLVRTYSKNNKNVTNKFVTYRDNSLGQFNTTNQPLDIAIIHKDRWLIVKTNKNKIYLTKNGSIKINKENFFTINGNLLIGIDKKPIKIPKNNVPKIQNDGTVIVRNSVNLTSYKKKIGQIGCKKISINKLLETSNGLFKIKKEYLNKYRNKINTIEIKTGVLEGSNVNPITNITNIMSQSRTFEMLMKIIYTKNENEKRTNQVLNINS